MTKAPAPAPIPHDEARRLQSLRAYEVLDTPPEPQFDDLTRLAAEICGAPMATITLVDADRQWIKSRIGGATAQTSLIALDSSHVLGILPPRVLDHLEPVPDPIRL